MKDEQREGEWAVFDKNARMIDDATGTTIPRVHTVRPGVNYALRNDKPCWMPENDARVFLKDPSFVVWNSEQEEVPPLASQALERNVPNRLPPNMVIADLNELTSDALLTRAMQRQGSHRFSADTRREALVRFLQDGHGGDTPILHQLPARGLPAPADQGDDLGVEDFSEDGDEARRILEGA